MYDLTAEDEFSAAHFLKLCDGSWEHRHGHNWKVAVMMRSTALDSMGVVFDFELLKPALKKVLAGLHETSLNEHPRFKGAALNSSTENIARLIYDKLFEILPADNARIVKVTVWETPDACASYLAET